MRGPKCEKLRGALQGASVSVMFGQRLLCGTLNGEHFRSPLWCVSCAGGPQRSYAWTELGRVQLLEEDRDRLLLS